MTTRERRDTDLHARRTVLADPPDAGDPRPREDGEAFLAAADAAIRRALSRNAAEFLRANRQQSGQ